jgi:hypothetical protein
MQNMQNMQNIQPNMPMPNMPMPNQGYAYNIPDMPTPMGISK